MSQEDKPNLDRVDTTLMSTAPSSLDSEAVMRLARGGSARTPRVSLLIYHRDGTQVATLDEGQQLVIGRGVDSDVCVRDSSLSRRHARFEVIGGEAWVEDMGSTNGTKVNGERVERARVGVADEATMGSVTASVHVLAPIDARLYGLDSHDSFLSLLEDEVVRARCFGRAFALLMLRVRDSQPARMASHTPLIKRRLREVDRLALYSPHAFELLLPEATREQAVQLAGRLRSERDEAEDGPAGTSPLNLLCGIAVYPECGTSANELIEVCRVSARDATDEKPVQVVGAAQQRSLQPRPASVQATGAVVASPVMQQLYETIGRLAKSTIPVLLIGETGTGKEVVARALHDQGQRRKKRMACINCGAIPATLVESALFGHEKGSFTGASQQAKGLFEEADGGTVLLDEVGELTPSAQSALLRVLEEKRIKRVGSSKELSVDVRIIAATHRDLEAMCEAGKFRWDLLYRLNAMTLRVPALRERPEEISMLADLFVREAAATNRCEVSGVDTEAMRRLLRYAWPGNVRELKNAMERAVVVSESGCVTVDDLPQRIVAQSGGVDDGGVSRLARSTRATERVDLATAILDVDPPDTPELEFEREPTGGPEQDEPLDFRAAMQRHEATLLVDALRRSGWNRTAAARMLQMPVRTLSHKIRQHGIKKLGYALEDDTSDDPESL